MKKTSVHLNLRRVIVAGLGLGLSLVLSGCNNSTETPDKTAKTTAAAAPASREEPIVYVYNWSDYIDESILADFEKETGIKVVYDVFDSNEVLETKLLAGSSGYDVVVPTASFLSRQIQAGVFQPLNRDLLSNWDHQWSLILDRVQKYDPENRYAINYMWGTTGIGYNVDMVLERLSPAPTDSWELVFNPYFAEKFADCGIYMLDAPDELFPAALRYLRLEPDSQNPDDLRKAQELLLSVRKYVRKYHSSEYINALANGDICLAVGWSGDILQARDRAEEADNGVEIAYRIPQEGTQMWFDMMAIPADAPHPNNAHAFINYILRPEVAAKASNYVYYANGNKTAQELLDDEVLGDPGIYPTRQVVQNLFTVQPYTQETQRIVTRLWNDVKSAAP